MSSSRRPHHPKAYAVGPRAGAVAVVANRGPQVAQSAEERAPARLGSSDLDPVYGAVNWPLALQDDVYSAQREELNGIFANRAAGKVGSSSNFRIQQVSRSMLDLLRERIRNYTSSDYIYARRFLESLAAEPQYAAR